MPVNDRYPLADVLAECRRYVELRGRRVFVEYVMLGGVNDSPEHAEELARVLGGDAFKVNMIPYNPTGGFEGSSREAIERVQIGARPPADPVDRAADAGPRDRGGLRAARDRRSGCKPSRKRSSLACGRHPRRSSYMRRRPVQILAFAALGRLVLAAAGCGSQEERQLDDDDHHRPR